MASSLFLLSSCCKQPYQLCEGFDTVNSIVLKNFYLAELDSVWLYKCVKNTNCISKTDSIKLENWRNYNGSTLQWEYILNNYMDTNHDYLLLIKDTNKSYTIENFIIDQETCKRCGEKRFKYNYIKNYLLNGSIKNIELPLMQIIIEK